MAARSDVMSLATSGPSPEGRSIRAVPVAPAPERPSAGAAPASPASAAAHARPNAASSA
jgi:hypothetical protein